MDFPAPFGPINPNISPFLIPKVGYCRISVPLIYDFFNYIALIGSFGLLNILSLSYYTSYSTPSDRTS